jgi:hypothetical protein
VIWPWLVLAVKQLLGFTVLAFVVIFGNFSKVMRTFAQRVTEEAVRQGLPLRLADVLYWVAGGLCLVEFLLGFTALSWLWLRLLDMLF